MRIEAHTFCMASSIILFPCSFQDLPFSQTQLQIYSSPLTEKCHTSPKLQQYSLQSPHGNPCNKTLKPTNPIHNITPTLTNKLTNTIIIILIAMANPSLLQSSASSFVAQFGVFPSPLTSKLIYRNGNAGMVPPLKISASASASGSSTTVLVEKSEAEKPHRLKTTYTDKIVPLLMEEFNYTNIHEVVPCSCFICCSFLLECWISWGPTVKVLVFFLLWVLWSFMAVI